MFFDPCHGGAHQSADRIDGSQSGSPFRPATQTRPETRAFGGRRIRIKTHIFAIRRTRRADRPAINVRRGDCHKKSPVKPPVSGACSAITSIPVEFHGARLDLAAAKYSPFSDVEMSSRNWHFQVRKRPVFLGAASYIGWSPKPSHTMSDEIDYVLGTHREEIERLGLQHRVWQPLMLDAWVRAGIGRGSHFVDFGCGPGFATLDAAGIVGPLGKVVAIERSGHFLEFGKDQCARQVLGWVQFIEADLDVDDLRLVGIRSGLVSMGGLFCRLARSSLIDRISAACASGGRRCCMNIRIIRPGRSFRGASVLLNSCEKSWLVGVHRAGNPTWWMTSSAHGFCRLEGSQPEPLISAIGPSHFTWAWPAAFVASGSRRLADLGRISKGYADEIRADFRALEQNSSAVMVTPLVLEIIAEKI